MKRCTKYIGLLAGLTTELSYAANLAWATTKGSFGIRVSGTSVSTY